MQLKHLTRKSKALKSLSSHAPQTKSPKLRKASDGRRAPSRGGTECTGAPLGTQVVCFAAKLLLDSEREIASDAMCRIQFLM